VLCTLRTVSHTSHYGLLAQLELELTLMCIVRICSIYAAATAGAQNGASLNGFFMPAMNQLTRFYCTPSAWSIAAGGSWVTDCTHTLTLPFKSVIYLEFCGHQYASGSWCYAAPYVSDLRGEICRGAHSCTSAFVDSIPDGCVKLCCFVCRRSTQATLVLFLSIGVTHMPTPRTGTRLTPCEYLRQARVL
jgi:hypothetical protein